MAEDLRTLAAKYVTLTEEIEATRRAMLTALTANGAGVEAPKTTPFDQAERPGQKRTQAMPRATSRAGCRYQTPSGSRPRRRAGPRRRRR
jgi:hypothetical protein